LAFLELLLEGGPLPGKKIRLLAVRLGTQYLKALPAPTAPSA